eukprot:scaffold798_cov133-Isochrysis_galbana.AAC.1
MSGTGTKTNANALPPRLLARCWTSTGRTESVLMASATPASTPSASLAWWEYKLSGGAQLAPHRLYVLSKTPHAPERGVGRPPRDSPPPSEHEV